MAVLSDTDVIVSMAAIDSASHGIDRTANTHDLCKYKVRSVLTVLCVILKWDCERQPLDTHVH